MLVRLHISIPLVAFYLALLVRPLPSSPFAVLSLVLSHYHHAAMAKTTPAPTEVVELGNMSPEKNGSPQPKPSMETASIETDPVAKLGLKPTVPRTLDRLIGLIGVNSSVVCPWPNFYFVSVLNLANGGTAGLLLGTIIACLGMTPVYLSLAEKMRKCDTIRRP